MHYDAMPTCREILAARKKLGESQATLALRFQVNQVTIHRWETYAAPRYGPARMAVEKLLDSLQKVGRSA